MSSSNIFEFLPFCFIIILTVIGGYIWVKSDNTKIKRPSKFRIRREIENGEERFYVYKKTFPFYYRRVTSYYTALEYAITSMIELKREEELIIEKWKKQKKDKKEWVSDNDIKIGVL
jgi:hypothetical protein